VGRAIRMVSGEGVAEVLDRIESWCLARDGWTPGV